MSVAELQQGQGDLNDVPKLSVEGGLLCARASFPLKDLVRALPGRLWKPAPLRAWTWPATPAYAARLVEQLQNRDPTWDDAVEELLSAASRAAAATAMKTADDLPPIPITGTRPPWKHQLQAYWWAIEQDAALLALHMGCVDGDAEVVVNRGGASRRMTLAELHRKFQGGATEYVGANGARGSQSWRPDVPTRIRGMKADGTVGLVPLLATLDKGSQPVLRVVLASGRTLRCTPDHELLTADRRKAAAETLRPGDRVLCDEVGGRGWSGEGDAARERSGRRPVAWERAYGTDRGGYVWVKDPAHPNATPAGMVLEHVRVMVDIIGRPLVAPECVHHVNGVRHDNRPENLVLCADHTEHMRLHGDHRRNLAGSLPVLDAVVSIEPDGEAAVYDVTVDDDAHTWVADGLVVANCGKSRVAIDLLQNRGAQRVLIMCPSKVLGVWPNQFVEHAAPGRPWHVVNGMRARRDGKLAPLPIAERLAEVEHAFYRCTCGRPHAAVLNYETTAFAPVKTWKPRELDYLVLDEGQKIKAAGGVHSRWCHRVGKLAGRRLELTGTPMPQSPLDIYGQYRALDETVFGTNHRSFLARYAVMGGYLDHQVVGIAKPGELAEKFASLCIQVGADVLDLPEFMDTERTCTLSPEGAKVYRSVEKTMWAELESGQEITVANALVRLIRLQQMTGGATKTDDGRVVVIDTSKAQLLADVLEEIGSTPATMTEIDMAKHQFEPVVVFAKFHHDLDVIAEVARATGRIYGEISGRRGDGLNMRGQYADHCDLIGVQLQSGGSGIDLTRARHGIYYSVGHSLTDYEQSRARLHRPGQRHGVVFTHLVVANTVDPTVYEALSERRKVIDAVLATHDLTTRDGIVVRRPPD